MYYEFSTANIQIDKDFSAKLSGYGCVSHIPESEISNSSPVSPLQLCIMVLNFFHSTRKKPSFTNWGTEQLNFSSSGEFFLGFAFSPLLLYLLLCYGCLFVEKLYSSQRLNLLGAFLNQVTSFQLLRLKCTWRAWELENAINPDLIEWKM